MNLALVFLLLSVPLTAAGNLIAGKYALRSFDPAEANALRYGLALCALVFIARRWPRPSRRELPLLALTGVSGICVYNLLFFASLRLIPASEAALLEMTIPAASLLLAWLVLRETIGARQLVGVLVAGAGTLWLLRILPRSAELAKSARDWRGEVLMLIAVAVFAGYAILSKFAMRRLPPPAVATWSCFFGAIPLIAIAVPSFATAPDTLGDASFASWAGVVYGALIGFVFNIIAWYYCFRAVGVARTNVFLYLVPVFGAVLAMAIFDERLTGWQIFGSFVTLVGVVIATIEPRALVAARLRPRSAVVPSGEGVE